MPMISMAHEGATLFAHDSQGPSKHAVFSIHGGLANHLSGLRLAEPIAADARIIAPDLRGSGRSIFPSDASVSRARDGIGIRTSERCGELRCLR